MKEFILSITILFIYTLALSVGIGALKKYKMDTEQTYIGFWKGMLIVVGFSVISILIIPLAIAKWSLNTIINFKEE